MMSKKSDKLSEMLKIYEFDEEQRVIYLNLLERGMATALQLSRLTKIARTTIYRKLGELADLGVIIEREGPYGAMYESTGTSGFEKLISDRDQKLTELKSNLDELNKYLSQYNLNSREVAKVSTYQNIKGLEQAIWNQLYANRNIYVFETGEYEKYVTKKFAEKLRREVVARDLKIHVLTNEEEIADFSQEHKFIRDHWEIRHINKSKFEIESEVFVYDKTILHLNYKEQDLDICVVEVVDKNLAKFQKNIFKKLWSESLPMIRISPDGRSKVMPNP